PGAVVYPIGTPGVPLSRRELRKKMSHNPFFEWLDNYNLRDVTFFKDDFDNVALNTTNDWNVSVGAGATTWAVLAGGENGLLRGVHGGTAATSGLQLSRPATLTGDRFCGMECYFQTSNVTAKRIEIGFVDVVTAVNTTIVNNLTTPTFNAGPGDAAVYVFDNTAATNTMGLYCLNSDGATAAKAAFTAQLPVISTFVHVRVEVKTDSAWLWVNGQQVASITGVGAAGAIEGGTKLLPIFNAKSGDTNTGNIDIDYVHVYADRVTQA
ncbi:MAG: hypothetical protein ACRESF_25675, partial [Pseudomonas sp.]